MHRAQVKECPNWGSVDSVSKCSVSNAETVRQRPSKLILKESYSLNIPNEIFTFMQQPSDLWVADSSEGLLIELEDRVSLVGRWGYRILRILHGWKRMPLRTIDSDFATYSDRNDRIPTGTYAIGNYFPLFQLFRVSDDSASRAEFDRATVNAKAWASIADYHEHLGLADQDSSAHEVSRLIARTIASHTANPKRILELGCGSGRNLYWLSKAFPDAEIVGIDINPSADIRRFLPNNVRFLESNVLEFDFSTLGEFDVIFTCGFLMHINHRDVERILRTSQKYSDYTIHFELHGTANEWDFHRYPRDYGSLFLSMGLPVDAYEIFAGDDTLSHQLTKSFSHALLKSSHPLAFGG